MKAVQAVEVEKKYDVGDDAVVPQLQHLPGVARVGEAHTAELEAVYFDTAQRTLQSRRITLRRRTGGTDAGWHLKLPAEAAAAEETSPRVPAAQGAVPGGTDPAASEPPRRRELHAPLGQPDVVPDSLLAYVQAFVRGNPLVPVVRLKTERTTYPLYGPDGVHLADLADDRVDAQPLGGGTSSGGKHWREWELELVHGPASLFEPAGQVLAAAGARPAGHASKLAKALGAGGTSKVSGSGTGGALLAGKNAPAAAVVTVFLAGQLKQLLDRDAGVRLEEPEAIHDMRSAARRMRSALAAYRKLYRAVPVRRLRDELSWLGGVLGAPRDAEVLRSRLLGQIDELPPGEGAEAARDFLDRRAGATFDAGYRLLQEALVSERYFRLLDSLEDFRDTPPVRGTAVEPGRRAVAKAVDKSAKRIRRSHKAASHARRGTERETALHQVRKDAKRLRHVAESAAAVSGKRARKVAKAAHRQQKILGDYHDAVIARDLLAGLGSEAPAAATEAITALLARQHELMSAAEHKYRKARRKSRDLLRGGVL
ncbi:CHAD domain containing protein [Pseudarthrobacter chlorophenolicus A6]|uniref:CHAD domain containing protein n=1 Tax=Pseudarthrobacter chlorophenolicus (strain ATCC 700700 / DSM 12829 / CIP 107037 / JCM 12360 / KCTC 9906 / NCIMB 13794 / A6) TaxID=452863 RepID=B8HDQ0_PSECP|nr:CYTH and CHAD domain-containing protein [Pseudarthrobacter chlorophenolicus]ACL40768.1 CHAD domain containing protein [Pseudarthrobacter chlorophenolicus A6]SDQ75412.1 CHAD domain-containing protein [Pseudarthrobacter chlorophenolicus]